MPKRTNYFQQLIHHIYQQLVPAGAIVTESSLLTERSSGTQREVDILVEHSIAGHKIRMGIECRDRTSKDDITWVDSVIGKYRDLDVDKVVLVSSSGFSEGAKKKATAHNIESLVLVAFSDFDLQQSINALRMSFINRSDQIKWALISTDPKLEDGDLDPALTVYTSEGNIFGDVESTVKTFYDSFAKDHITSHINRNMNAIFPNNLEFDHEKTFDVPMSIPAPYPYFIMNQEKYFINNILLSIQCKFSGREKPVDNYWYSEHQIAVVHLTDKNKMLIVSKQN